MIEKYSMITFNEANGAIKSEKALQNAATAVRLIPLPAELSAGCGFALKVAPEDLEAARQIISALGVEISGCYSVEKSGLRKTYRKN